MAILPKKPFNIFTPEIICQKPNCPLFVLDRTFQAESKHVVECFPLFFFTVEGSYHSMTIGCDF